MHSLNLIKYWKGQHIINISEKLIQQNLQQKKRIRLCKPECLVWTPPDKHLPTASSSSSSSSSSVTTTTVVSNNSLKKK